MISLCNQHIKIMTLLHNGGENKITQWNRDLTN